MAPWWLCTDEDLKGEPAGNEPRDTAGSSRPEVTTDSQSRSGQAPEARDDNSESKKRKRRRRRRRRPSGTEDSAPAKSDQGEKRPRDKSERDEPKVGSKSAGSGSGSGSGESEGQDRQEPEGESPREAKKDSRKKPERDGKKNGKNGSKPSDKRGRKPKREARSEDSTSASQDEAFTHSSRDNDMIESMSPGMLYAPDRSDGGEERKIAMFVDFENIALGVRDSEVKSLEVPLILERLLEKGKIVVKRAYCDWERYKDYKRPLHEAAIELIDIPQKYYSGKNSADIKMVVDALDLCYSKDHLDTFVLVSGDSDFSPLVSKLKENDKYVIGLGVKNSSSSLLIDNCDEFIYYEDVWRDSLRAPRLDHLPRKQAECFQLLAEAVVALLRENKDVLWGSLIKQTMKRKRPSFNEGYYGYGSFSELLEDAQKNDVVRLRRDRRSGSYIVTGFATRQR